MSQKTVAQQLGVGRAWGVLGQGRGHQVRTVERNETPRVTSWATGLTVYSAISLPTGCPDITVELA